MSVHTLPIKVWLFIFSVPIIISITLILIQYGPKGKEKKPHILFVLVDNIGWNDVGYHNSEIETPTLDHLAEEGVKLENYYVQPLSTASISQLLTGRSQIYTGLQHGEILHGQPLGLPLTEVTLAEKLKDVGYSTHIIGKWQMGFYREEYLPTNRGFDSFYGILGGGDNQMKCTKYRASGSQMCGVHLYNDTQPVLNMSNSLSLVYNQQVENVLKRHDDEKPIFVYVSLHPETKPLVSRGKSERLSRIRWRPQRDIHADFVEKIDDFVANLTDIFKKHGLWENTIMMFSSDSGGDLKLGANNWPLRGGKGTHWDGAMRGVGFVHSPLLSRERFPTGDDNYELMHISDWFSTLLHLAGGSTEGLSLDGFNQWPTIKYKSPSPRKDILHNIDPIAPRLQPRLYRDTFDNTITAAIRSGDWKLITGFAGSGSSFPPAHLRDDIPYDTDGLVEEMYANLRLYNIAVDPTEHHEVSQKHPDVVRQLLDDLEKYYEKSVPVSHPLLDIGASPELHDGVWEPWIS